MVSSPDEILAQIGLKSNGGRKYGGGTESTHQLASKALVHLIQSGKLSINDATEAVNAAKTARSPPSANESADSKTSVKSNKLQEKYRTRHIALQFSYDGTDFSGFAQNIGKDEDNSVEKALFAALEKTRLLLDPSLVDFSARNDGGARNEGGGADTSEMSARTASKYSRCGRTDKGEGLIVACLVFLLLTETDCAYTCVS